MLVVFRGSAKVRSIESRCGFSFMRILPCAVFDVWRCHALSNFGCDDHSLRGRCVRVARRPTANRISALPSDSVDAVLNSNDISVYISKKSYKIIQNHTKSWKNHTQSYKIMERSYKNHTKSYKIMEKTYKIIQKMKYIYIYIS